MFIITITVTNKYNIIKQKIVRFLDSHVVHNRIF